VDAPGYFDSVGGSYLGILGTLTNTGNINVGESNLGATTDVSTVGGLVNTGTITLEGNAALGSSAEAALGTEEAPPTTWTGTAIIRGNADLELGTGSVQTIASGAAIFLVGADAAFSADSTPGNSALVGLTDLAGEFHIAGDYTATGAGGVTVNTTGNLDVTGSLDVDAPGYFDSVGGSTLTIGGTLTNNNGVTIGEDNLGAPTTVVAEGLVNSSSVIVTGNTSVAADAATLTINGSVTNNSTITASYATIDIDGPVSGSATISLGGSDAVVGLASFVEDGQFINFDTVLGNGGTIEMADPAGFAGTVGGMTVGSSNTVPTDVIDLTAIEKSDVTGASLDIPTEILSITTSNAGTLQLQLNGNFANGTVVDWIADDAGTGTDVFLSNVACYCRGTRILAETGEVEVEALSIGDRVVTRGGALRRVKWIGRRNYDPRFAAGNRAVLPICIKAGAFGDGLPRRDLYLSPHHALLLDEALVPAELLVNGVSVVHCEAEGQIDYFHIELDSHDVIFAEGAPAETFVDCDSRRMFRNAAEFEALYPGEEPPRWAFCAPRLEAGPELATIRRRIEAQAGLAGSPQRLEEAVAAEIAAAETAAALDPAIGLLLREAARLIDRRAKLAVRAAA
jgi:hypothetical protein